MNSTLFYHAPAAHWTEALPIGNGRLGAMVFGGIKTERLQFNEDTLWSGRPQPWDNPGARDVLPEVRAAIFAGDYERADVLAKQMQGTFNQSYLPLGDLWLEFDPHRPGDRLPPRARPGHRARDGRVRGRRRDLHPHRLRQRAGPGHRGAAVRALRPTKK